MYVIGILVSHIQVTSVLQLVPGHEDSSHVPDETWVTDATAPPITYVSSYHEPGGTRGAITQAPLKKKEILKKE